MSEQQRTVNYREIVVDGLWKNNPGLVQLLGLCPLLAVTNNAINGFGLGRIDFSGDRGYTRRGTIPGIILLL